MVKIIFTLLSLITSFDVIAKDIFIDCYDSQISDIVSAKQSAVRLLTIVIEENKKELYNKWFYSADHTIVRNNLIKIKHAILNNSTTFNCSCKSDAIFAFINREIPYLINLCAPFWEADEMGQDSKSGTLIHEYSHFNEIIGTFDLSPYYKSTLEFSIFGRAEINANSYEYICEDSWTNQ